MNRRSSIFPTTFLDSDKIISYREIAQKTRDKEDLWSWYVLRRISIYFSLLFIKLRISPNTITWLSLILILLSGLCLMFPSQKGFILAFVFYNFGYLFDCVDGEMARILKKTSKKGHYIDILIQAASVPVYISVGYSFFILHGVFHLNNLEAIFLYFMTVLFIFALFIPISLQLIQLKETAVDPVNKIRNKAALFAFIAYSLGLPGFFFYLLLLALFQNSSLILYYFLAYVLINMLKTVARLFITVKNIQV